MSRLLENTILTLVRLAYTDRRSFDQYVRNLTASNNHVITDEMKKDLKLLVPEDVLMGNVLR